MTASRDRRGLTGLLVAVGVSGLGTRMSFVALPWFVLVTTGSVTSTGLVGFAEIAPYVAVQALGGPLVDRLGPRRVSVLSDLGAAVLVGAVPLAVLTGGLGLPALLVLVALAGALRGAGDTARHVLVPRLQELARVPIERAAGLHDGVARVAGLLGAPAAGVLVAVSSAPAVLAIDALSFAVSAVVVAGTVPRSTAAAVATGAGPAPTVAGYLTELREGFAALRRDRLLLGIAGLVAVTNLLDQAGGAVLLPVWARDVAHSPVALGLLGGAFGLGAVAGNAVTTWAGHRLPRRWTFAVGFAVAGAPRFVVLALASSLGPVLPVLVLAGRGRAASTRSSRPWSTSGCPTACGPGCSAP